MKKLPALIVALVSSWTLSAAETKLSQLQITPDSVGDGWSGPTGLVIDDLDSPPTEPQEIKKVAADLQKQMRPLGVKALADFTYRKAKDPLHQVTIRVFLFEKPDQCTDWMKAKYQFVGWEKKYKKVKLKDHVAYESLEMKKRIVAFDRVWITAGTVADTDDHLRILDLYVAAVRKEIEKSAEPVAPPDRSQPAVPLQLTGGGADRTGERRLDRSKEFAFFLPYGWKVVPAPKGAHDILVLPADDGKNRNIVINDQPGTSPLAELKWKYERDLPKALKDFQLISGELVELEGKRQAIRIIHTNTTPGVPVRQINYVVEMVGRRYFIACTVLQEDGDKYDKVFETFVSSMMEPDK